MLMDEHEESVSGLNRPCFDVTKGNTKIYPNFFLAKKQLTLIVHTYNYSYHSFKFINSHIFIDVKGKYP
jgi:hypothetical protein